MRYEFQRKDREVGSAQWEGPGQVRLDVEDPAEREYLNEYFAGQVTYLASHFDDEEDALQHRRRDWTPWEFERACRALTRTRGYRVRKTPSEAVEAPRRHAS